MSVQIFPTSNFDQSAITPVFLGTVVSWVLTETLGWIFAGLVVSGYLATLLVLEPRSAAIDIGEAVLTYGIARVLIVQAPHTFFDERTLPLGCEMFARANAAAFFIDTAHRYKAAASDEAGNNPADVAHAADSMFQAATQGVLRAMQNVSLVQLHGFASRESGFAVVLSAGTKRPKGDLLWRVQSALRPLGLGPIARFPDESSELGATTNVQGALVRARGGRFLHIEMSSAVRASLLANSRLRARFFDVLLRSLAGQ